MDYLVRDRGSLSRMVGGALLLSYVDCFRRAVFPDLLARHTTLSVAFNS
jgi:hypothetical protein